jgi:hypothetical protein
VNDVMVSSTRIRMKNSISTCLKQRYPRTKLVSRVGELINGNFVTAFFHVSFFFSNFNKTFSSLRLQIYFHLQLFSRYDMMLPKNIIISNILSNVLSTNYIFGKHIHPIGKHNSHNFVRWFYLH